MYICDERGFVREGQRKLAYAVMFFLETIYVQALSVGKSSQAAELMVLCRTLELAKGKHVCRYMDSKFEFNVLHMHSVLWHHPSDPCKTCSAHTSLVGCSNAPQ